MSPWTSPTIGPALLGLATIPALMLILSLAMMASVAFFRWWSLHRSLNRLKQEANRLAKGKDEHALRIDGPPPVVRLAQVLNRMAQKLGKQLQAESRQRNELEAVLASMAEGVLAIDGEDRVIRLNRAGGEILGVDPSKVLGRPLHEVTRNASLLSLMDKAANDSAPVRDQVTIYYGDESVLELASEIGAPSNSPERNLQAHASVLRDPQGHRIGTMVVLHDVTRLRRLETIRQEFVANVSHELKTPVTAIKGFVETLLEEDQEHEPQDRQRFLRIISHQTNRLANLLEDLLVLARLEQNEDQQELQFEPGYIEDVMLMAMEACRPNAEQKNITLHLQTHDDAQIQVCPQLLEQAIVNLIDNAIKYSDEGSNVWIRLGRQSDELILEVEDEGTGIEAKHLPRLFERFYRVDRARSRMLGGTGLGLAIVKHVVQSHGGRVTVSSHPGEGSRFRIHLPCPPLPYDPENLDPSPGTSALDAPSESAVEPSTDDLL